MAGLLGQGWDDPQSAATMQLAGGLLSGNFGAGASAYGATMAGAKDATMKRQYMQSQIDDHLSQAEARKLSGIKDARQQSLIESMFGPMGGTQGASGAPAAANPGGAPGASASSAQGGGSNLLQLARQLGIPEQAIQADMVFNGGKKISELLAERSKPNWQNVNGNLVNTSAQGFSGGLQGGMASSADGKVTAWQPDGKGGLVVGAPAGALDTFRAYQGAGASFKPIKVYNPATGREEFTNEGAVVGGQQPAQGGAQPGYANEPQMKATVAGPMGADPASLQREIRTTQNDLMKPLDANSKTLLREHLADLQRQAQRVGAPQMGNFAAGPSAQEKAQQDARATLSQGVAKTASENLNTSLAGAQSAMGTLQNVEQIRSGLGNAILGPGANARVTLGQLGQVLGVGGADSAEQLVNTRNVIQGLARQELSAAGQMKGQGQITESERSILRKAEAGSINEFSKPEIVTLMGALERSANYRVDQHRQSVEKLRSGADPTSFLDVNQPAPKAAPAPSGKTIVQTGMYGGKKVVKYSDGSTGYAN